MGQQRLINFLYGNPFKIIFFCVGLFSSLNALCHYQMACEFYDKNSISQNTSFFHPGLPWIWARADNDQYILAKGKKYDGFFEIESLFSKSKSLFSSEKIYHKNSYLRALNFCANSLKRAFPDAYQQKAVAKIIFKSSFLSLTNFTPVFSKEEVSSATAFDRLIIFGDSLSDQGNLKNWLRVFPPEKDYFAGRFSNGPIWIDRFEHSTGIAVQNWAVGGSMAKPHEDPEFNKHKFKEGTYLSAALAVSGTVQKEIQRYTKNALSAASIARPASSLFLIWIGGNDYLTWLGSSKDANIFIDEPEHPRAGSSTIVEGVTESIIDHLKALYAIGARQFLVVNMPNLGTMPRLLDNVSYYLANSDSDDKRLHILSESLEKVALLHNKILEQKLTIFMEEYKDSKVHRLDSFHGVEDGLSLLEQNSIGKGTSFGYDLDFVKTVQYDTKQSVIDRACFVGGVFGARKGRTCLEPNSKKFWDNVHPSAWTHCVMAINLHKTLAKANLLRDFDVREYLQDCKPELL